MSHDARVTIAWGESEATEFRLAYGQAHELERATGETIYDLLEMAVGTAKALEDIGGGRRRTGGQHLAVRHAREIIRLGLVGGGAKPADALRLVRLYCEERPLIESVAPALRILEAAILGVPDQPVGKASGEVMPDASASPLPASMEAAP